MFELSLIFFHDENESNRRHKVLRQMFSTQQQQQWLHLRVYTHGIELMLKTIVASPRGVLKAHLILGQANATGVAFFHAVVAFASAAQSKHAVSVRINSIMELVWLPGEARNSVNEANFLVA